MSERMTSEEVRELAEIAKEPSRTPTQRGWISMALDAYADLLDKLPKTADGVTVVPGMKVFVVYAGQVEEAWIECDTETGFDMGDDIGTAMWCAMSDGLSRDGSRYYRWCDVNDCYSTREAAEAARNQP